MKSQAKSVPAIYQVGINFLLFLYLDIKSYDVYEVNNQKGKKSG